MWFMDERLYHLEGKVLYYFIDGVLGYNNFSIDLKDQ